METLNFALAENHLVLAEKAYAEVGTAGYLALTYFIKPLRVRYNSGERTEQLYNEIMAIEV